MVKKSLVYYNTAPKTKFSSKDFFSKWTKIT